LPTVLRWNGYRFYFFSNEGDEPAHIHIDRDDATAKIWLEDLSVARAVGFSTKQLRELSDKVRDEREQFLEAWRAYFSR
jgi:hypothetical protein